MSLVYVFFKTLYIGRTNESHLILLKRIRLIDELDSNPQDFIMGRLRQYHDSIILFDVCSDLQLSKTDINPLTNKNLKKEFEIYLSEYFRGKAVYIINKGLKNRVPGITSRKLKSLLKTDDKNFYRIKTGNND